MKIKSIKINSLSEPKAFYDITVDEYHNFVIGSSSKIVTHNSSLSGAIVGMAQKFKNSMPVLEDIGQFGSLRAPEAAAPRYIATKLHKNFRLLYMDFELLTPRYEEGNEIEPKYFLPIIPTVLLNGGSGIAVGFATNILNRNPLDLIDACLKELDGKKYDEPKPWYYGFNGPIHKDESGSWIFSGKFEIKNTSTVHITELIPSMTYEKFDSLLDSLEDRKILVSSENSGKSDINYLLKFRREDLKSLTESGRLIRTLKMEEKETENFTVLDEFGNLKIFNNAIEIIKYFINFRLTYYAKRKEYLINKITQELLLLSNKAKFIKFIIESKIKINNVPKQQIIQSLTSLKFDMINDSYSYLLSLPIHTLTKETYESLILEESNKTEELAMIKSKEIIQMYRGDLLELKKAIIKTQTQN